MMDLSIHSCKGIRAKFGRGDASCWIEITLRSPRSTDEICVFFGLTDTEYAKRLVAAINSAQSPVMPVVPTLVAQATNLEEEPS